MIMVMGFSHAQSRRVTLLTFTTGVVVGPQMIPPPPLFFYWRCPYKRWKCSGSHLFLFIFLLLWLYNYNIIRIIYVLYTINTRIIYVCVPQRYDYKVFHYTGRNSRAIIKLTDAWTENERCLPFPDLIFSYYSPFFFFFFSLFLIFFFYFSFFPSF